MHRLFVFLIAIAIFQTEPVLGACVSNTNQLAAALVAAQNNGQDDVIRVVAGTYTLAAGLTFTSTEIHSLTISGGWDATCQAQTAAFSVLDGQHLYQPLDIENDNGDTAVDRLSIQGGVAPAAGFGGGGGGLRVSSVGGDVKIDLCEFIGNRSDGYAGGVSAGTNTGTLTIRNNLVFANHAFAFGGLFLFQDSGVAYVVGNTVVANYDTDAAAGGLTIGGNATFALADNILWNNNQNAGADLAASATHIRIANDIGIVGGTNAIPDFVSGELNVDPQFVQCGFLCFSFFLDARSPLVNAGNDAPYGGIASEDLSFGTRKIGTHVDIGAFESDVLFRDGFGL